MNKGQLATKYKISVKTLNKWLKPFACYINKENNNSEIYTPAEIQRIIEKLGPW